MLFEWGMFRMAFRDAFKLGLEKKSLSSLPSWFLDVASIASICSIFFLFFTSLDQSAVVWRSLPWLEADWCTFSVHSVASIFSCCALPSCKRHAKEVRGISNKVQRNHNINMQQCNTQVTKHQKTIRMDKRTSYAVPPWTLTCNDLDRLATNCTGPGLLGQAQL